MKEIDKEVLLIAAIFTYALTGFGLIFASLKTLEPIVVTSLLLWITTTILFIINYKS